MANLGVTDMINDAPIYYISTHLIDQIYRRQLGPNKERTLTEGQERAGGLSVHLGLNHLISILSGVQLQGEGRVDRKKSKSRTTTMRGVGRR